MTPEGHYSLPLADGPMKERESANAMPAPWLSAWGQRRGWPTKLPESRVGPLMPMWPLAIQRRAGGLGSPDTLALYHPNVPIFYRQRTGPGAPEVLRTHTYHPVYGYYPTAVPTGFAPPSVITRGSGQFPGLRDPRPAVTRGSGQFPGFREGGRLGALGDDWWDDGGGGGFVDDSGDSGPLLDADPGGAPDVGGGVSDWFQTHDSGGGDGGGGGGGGSATDWFQSGAAAAANQAAGAVQDVVDWFQSPGAAAANEAAGAEGSGDGGGGSISASDVKNWLAAAGGIVSPLLRGLFPAGIPALWTPCPKGTYWNGHNCAVSPTACPSGTVYNGTTCVSQSLLCSALGLCGGGGGGGEEGGGGEGGFAEGASLTSSSWFWPVVLAGGGLIVLVAVRRR